MSALISSVVESGIASIPNRLGISDLDKYSQYEAVRRLSPELSFEGWRVEHARDLPERPDRTLVIRPFVSPNSEGSALITGPLRPLSHEELDWLSLLGGPYLVHVYEIGQPVFLNGVMQSGRLILTDVWNCKLLPMGCRDILVGVVSYPRKVIPSVLVQSLESLASKLGIPCGPVHFELVMTKSGARVVKFAARSAGEPLLTLCHLGCWPSQVEVWNYLQANAAATDHPTGGSDTNDHVPYVGDFSFVLHQTGLVRDFVFHSECSGLDSFAGYYSQPLIGQNAQSTALSGRYGATVLLKNSQLQKLESDIEKLMIWNQLGAFTFS
jgi:hypothetical protein